MRVVPRRVRGARAGALAGCGEKEAAKLALEELSGEFYKRVGKTVVEKVLIWIGMLAVGFVVGKGWIVKV